MSQGNVSSLIEALIATAEPQLWQRYCRLAAELAGGGIAVSEPVFAIGSVEWQRRRDQPGKEAAFPLSAEQKAEGRRRLAQRGAPPAFAGAPSPLGRAGAARFDDFLARHRGSPASLAEITELEQQLVTAFEAAGRSGRFRATGFLRGAATEVEPEWFGQMRLDFVNDQLLLPDNSAISGVRVTLAAAGGVRTGERAARTMLRETLERLWERGVFTTGTGNEKVLALVLQDLQLSPSDPPYGFKSAETIRKLRKTLGMSL